MKRGCEPPGVWGACGESWRWRVPIQNCRSQPRANCSQEAGFQGVNFMAPLHMAIRGPWHIIETEPFPSWDSEVTYLVVLWQLSRKPNCQFQRNKNGQIWCLLLYHCFSTLVTPWNFRKFFVNFYLLIIWIIINYDHHMFMILSDFSLLRSRQCSYTLV